MQAILPGLTETDNLPFINARPARTTAQSDNFELMSLLKKSFHIKGRDFIRAGEASINVQNLLKSMGFDSRFIRRIAICGYESEMNVVMHGGDGSLSIEVDTDRLILEISDDGPGIEDIELAMQSGPFSLQGELFHTFTDADEEGDPHFWGFYLYGSFFLTGESRRYNIARATFTPEEPQHGFRPRKGRWGAWEVAFRYSYIDLNDERIKGGKERNITVGLNIYLHRKVRLMFNYVNARVEDRAEPKIHDASADIFQTRFQITF